METRNLRTIRPDGTESLDFYAEWAAPPAEAAEQSLRRWLIDSRLFAAILAPGSARDARLRAGGRDHARWPPCRAKGARARN